MVTVCENVILINVEKKFLLMFSAMSICLSVHLFVCVSVCVFVCPSIQAVTFEPLHIKISFLIYRYILTISRSSQSIKVIELSSR